MRTDALAIATAALFAFSASAFSQAVVEVGPRGGDAWVVHEGRSIWRPGCREMLRVCIHKEEPGEQGRGNCQQYRRMCGRD